MAMYCFCHCFLYARTECILSYRAVRKFYPKGVSELTNYVGELIFGEVIKVGSGI